MAKDIKIDIRKLPKPVRIALAIIPSVIAIVLVIYLSVIPKNKEVDKLRKEIAEQENQLSKTKTMAGKLEDLKKQNKKMLKDLEELKEYLPEEEEISSLLKQVSDLGLEAGLDILTWKPSSKRAHESGIVSAFPVSVSLTGSYHKLGSFFSSLTRLERIVNVSNINLGGPKIDDGEVILRVSFSAVTFVAVSEDDPAEAPVQ
jgi:type IV pilus assembly protein PilO